MLKFSIIFCFVVLAKLGETESATKCTFKISGSYLCWLDEQKMHTEEDMRNIEGEHLPDYKDENVTEIFATNSVIRIFPSLIIDRFINLQEARFEGSSMAAFNHPIEHCSNLKSLSIKSNQLMFIPSAIFKNCASMKTLILSDNAISGLDINAFEGLENLEELLIDFNNLINFDAALITRFSYLQRLDIGSNNIEHIGNFSDMSSLKYLNLENNRISSWDATILKNSENLISLQLGNNQIKKFDPKALVNLNQLEVLSIGGFLEEVPALQKLKNLRELSLQGNQLKIIKLDSFKDLTNLKYLNLSHNKLEILDYPSIPFVQLSRLDLSNNEISSIDPQLFENVTYLELFLEKNICFSSRLWITSANDFKSSVEPLLRDCFGSMPATGNNVTVLVISIVAGIVGIIVVIYIVMRFRAVRLRQVSRYDDDVANVLTR